VIVAVYYNNSDVRIQEMPKPEIADDEILVKIMASGICGSDVAEWYRVPKAPRILGHEATGVIEKTGNKVTRCKVGDRVFVSHHVPCNKCRYCLRGNHTACETLHTTNYYPGGFAQYIRVPSVNVESGVYKLPVGMSFEEGTFIEPLACAVRGQRLAAVQKDDVLLVIGSGVSGILHVQLAKFKGLNRVVVADINHYRLKMAEKFGADYAIDARENLVQKLRAINDGRLADQVVVCTGATQAALAALDCVDKGGVIVFFAVPHPDERVTMPINHFWTRETRIITSYYCGPPDIVTAIKLIETRTIEVDDLITRRLPLQDVAEGFRLLIADKASLKIIIKPHF